MQRGEDAPGALNGGERGPRDPVRIATQLLVADCQGCPVLTSSSACRAGGLTGAVTAARGCWAGAAGAAAGCLDSALTAAGAAGAVRDGACGGRGEGGRVGVGLPSLLDCQPLPQIAVSVMRRHPLSKPDGGECWLSWNTCPRLHVLCVIPVQHTSPAHVAMSADTAYALAHGQCFPCVAVAPPYIASAGQKKRVCLRTWRHVGRRWVARGCRLGRRGHPEELHAWGSSPSDRGSSRADGSEETSPLQRCRRPAPACGVQASQQHLAGQFHTR